MATSCGMGKISITPDLSTPLSGYMVKGRNSLEVHDPIQARVIAVKNNNDCFIIISLDLVAVDKTYTRKLAQKITDCFQIPSDYVFIHATHTHSGPGGNLSDVSLIRKAFPYMNGWAPYEESIVTGQHDQIMLAVEEAISSLESCEIYFGQGKVEGVASNRNSFDQPFDSNLKVVEFRYSSGESDVLYHFPCHPTILNGNSFSISADFPGVTSYELEKRENIRLALFLNGPSGDISTRFTRQESSFKEVERLGKILSEGVLRVLNMTEPVKDSPFKSMKVPLQLPTREVADSLILKKQLVDLQSQYEEAKVEGKLTAELRKIESRIEGVASSYEIGNKLQGIEEVETTLQILRMGGIFFIAIPGELFFETGKEMNEALGQVPLLIAGNTNDHLGYIVPKKYYESSSYESFMTLLKKGSSEVIRDRVIKDVRKMMR